MRKEYGDIPDLKNLIGELTKDLVCTLHNLKEFRLHVDMMVKADPPEPNVGAGGLADFKKDCW